jgi:triacylglycerol lipase
VQEAPLAFAWRLPFRWRQRPDDHVPVASGLPAVVLVHGFVCNRGFWLPWMQAMRGQGIPYVSVNLEPVFGDIDDYVVQIEDAVGRAERLTGQPPVLVGHSMGGLVLRAWLAKQPDARRVGRIITLGSPHMGTWLGRWSRMANGRQMRLGSPWLTRLFDLEAARGASPYARFTCWYSNTDNIVFPASTATLPGADNRLLEGMAHVALAYHPAVMRDALAGLAPGRRPSREGVL